MPQDHLQIALEHHRAGRLTQAEAGYRSVLTDHPDNPEALHWLGVLLCQAGQALEAIPLLESAAARRPGDAAYQYNLGQACLRAGRKDDAIAALDRAVQAEPANHAPALMLAQALLSRGKPGDAPAAVAALRQAQAGGLDSAESFHSLGLALLAAGRYPEAAEACRAALAKKPDDGPAFYHLALACRGARQPKETRKALIKALELDPAMAQAWTALAMLDAEAGNFAAAAGLFRRAISANAGDPTPHDGLARVLEQMGDSKGARDARQQARRAARQTRPADAEKSPADGAVAELERHLTPTPGQAQAHFAMAALLNIFPPVQTPADSVTGLFDRYAAKFEAHLVGTLQYAVPEAIAAALAPLWNGNRLDILDAGCGTGLCGDFLRPMARTLAGVDLSRAMIEKARERNLYDRLEVGDLVQSLRNAPASYDLLVCADVLIYLGEAAPFFEAALAALRPGGLLAFSVEAGTGDRYDLVPRSRRYTHSKAYLHRLATIYGFEQMHFETIVVRKEQEQAVNGYLVVLRVPATPAEPLTRT